MSSKSLHGMRERTGLLPGLMWAVAPLAIILLAASVHAEIPETLYCTQSIDEGPAFVSSERAVTSGGKVNTELLGSEKARALHQLALSLAVVRDSSLNLRQKLKEKAASGPVVLELRDSGLQGHFFSLEEGLEEAHVVVKGRVSSVRQGFANLRLGQMVELQVDQVLKGSIEGQELLFFFPGGPIDLWDVNLHIRYEEPGAIPAPGDEVILFYKNYSLNRHCPFISVLPAGVLTFRSGLAEKLPRIYRGAEKETSWSIEYTLEMARAALEKE